MGVNIGQFSVIITSYLSESNFKKKGFILSHGSSYSSALEGTSELQELVAAHHIVPEVKKQIPKDASLFMFSF